MSHTNVPAQGAGDDSLPRFERWMAIALLAFVPPLSIFVLPEESLDTALLPIGILSGVFLLSGAWMLVRDHRRRHSR